MVKIVKIAGHVSRFLPAPSIDSGQAVCVYPERSRRAVGIPSTTATRVDWNLGIGNWSLMNGGVK